MGRAGWIKPGWAGKPDWLTISEIQPHILFLYAFEIQMA
jgi:hypothetical protein